MEVDHGQKERVKKDGRTKDILNSFILEKRC